MPSTQRNLMRTTLVCFALALTASACVIHEDDQGPGTNPPPPNNGSVTPHSGRWFYDETTPISSNCPSIIDEGQGAGPFGIDQSSLAGFRVLPEDGTAPFLCTLSGTGFDCAERAAHTEDYRDNGIDAVVTIRATAQGTFSSASRASGRQDATVSCTGTQCAAYGGAALPCDFAVDFIVQAF
jgi:hypothetical protein